MPVKIYEVIFTQSAKTVFLHSEEEAMNIERLAIDPAGNPVDPDEIVLIRCRDLYMTGELEMIAQRENGSSHA